MAAEFTGERVIPGQVEPDLWNEHASRYAFAARFARSRRALDVGCGAGYGAAELARGGGRSVGVDNSTEALEYARAQYAADGVRYLAARAEALPFRDGSFDLVVAFEVIEHLGQWSALVDEARRVLSPDGLFIASTPNRIYYGESREASGPNPFHAHEFDFDGFRAAMLAQFPNVCVYLQNQAPALCFSPVSASGLAEVRVESADADPASASFFVAVCSAGEMSAPAPFVYLPSAANALRERQKHIAKLGAELRVKDAWLDQLRHDHHHVVELFREQAIELEQRTTWATDLDRQLKDAGERIAAAQHELEEDAKAMSAYEEKVKELEGENVAKTEWALETERRLSAEITQRDEELGRAVAALNEADHALEERTRWARELDRTVEDLSRGLSMFEASRWVKLGRRIGLGPKIRTR